MTNQLVDRPEQNLEIAIIGAGISGMCMAINLKKAGITSFKIFEKSDSLGGTWHYNTYPGCGCDVPSFLYSFSFEMKNDWTLNFTKQPEILQYLEDCADKYGIREYIQFNTAITGAFFKPTENNWHIDTASGETFKAKVLISACGQLNQPKIPNFPGLETFQGTQFHSARWNHQHDLNGKTVAVIGTGASAIQFVPEIAEKVKKLLVFQRSANWVFPKIDRNFTKAEYWILKTIPFVAKLYRWLIYLFYEFFVVTLTIQKEGAIGKLVRAFLNFLIDRQVKNEELKSQLKPDFPVGCKRVNVSSDYYQTLQHPNVELVTSPIKIVNPTSLVSEEGREYPIDTLIFATGFDTRFLSSLKIVGLNNQILADRWQDGAEAYKGIMVPGFPNFFMLYGPNTNTGSQSIIFMVECQVRYIMSCWKLIQKNALQQLDVKSDINSQFNQKLQVQAAKTVWNNNCTNWYKTESGKIVNNWPLSTVRYWLTTLQANPKDFNFS